MRTRDVPHDQWQRFLSGFTAQHRGDAIHIERVRGEAGQKSVLNGGPLMNIAAATHDGRIEVTAGAQSDLHIHSIGRPTHLSVSESDDGDPLGLQITAEDGCVTCVRVDLPELHEVPPGYYLG